MGFAVIPLQTLHLCDIKTGELVQPGKCLLCKCEDLILDLQELAQSSGHEGYPGSSGPEVKKGAEIGNPLSSLPVSPDKYIIIKFSDRLDLK